ncbi:hypothetical protein jhhlp_001227 [Lomentospora prolificans]|uniref:Histone-lysine N-methyltransferase, H3 lysine-36 specific n=1 Tax=Lomentospora prolificans TaxID=41688 RepID=A0A2N3NHV7_9PEZI|nr:hypothetical protein jhhlp_001227 [Lomentospora prolificans]
MPTSLGDVDRNTTKMANIQLGNAPAPSGLDSVPAPNSRTLRSSGIKRESRNSTMSPRENENGTHKSSATPDDTQHPKLSRKLSQKPMKREPKLFDETPDATDEACSSFKVIPDCLYGSKNMGSTDNDALDCDCKEDWRRSFPVLPPGADPAHDGVNYACGEDCINRATRVECVIGASGSCGDGCQNQRFQRKQYADVSVIKTEKKGYGLRANSDLDANDFVFEYIGEVINEPTFRRRMLQYDEEGIKHFYFMSLTKSEFVDATKKGNLGRFCNHSCNPNCYVDKWVVGDKLRMGIFVLRKIKAGEELTFNYNVDRYGADPQPCYCGEPECVGFIGGKTQTERATKLPVLILEALGIDDGDGWDTTVAKKPRRKRPEEDDEEYVNSIQAKSLDEDGARKVMAALMQCKEKWIAIKLLERIQKCDDNYVLNIVMRMHAYQIMKTMITSFAEDDNVILQVLDVLDRMPRLTKNKIVDSNIEATIQGLKASDNEEISGTANRLLEDWGKLQVAYRIKRKKLDPNAQTTSAAEALRGAVVGDDRDNGTSTPASKPVSPLPSNIEIPKGPKSSVPQRNFQPPRGPRRHQPFPRQSGRFPKFGQEAEGPLPEGWFAAQDNKRQVYYYNKHGQTTWQRPAPPKQPTQAEKNAQIIQNIIDNVAKEQRKQALAASEAPVSSTQTPPESSDTPLLDAPTEKWRQLPIEKQMKIYENTIFPHIRYVLDKFRHKLPRDELKRFAKDLGKKLVASDYKNNRVQDPTATLNDKQVKKVKSYVKDFLDRAVVKYREHEKVKATRDATKGVNGERTASTSDPAPLDIPNGTLSKEDSLMAEITPGGTSSPEDGESHSPGSPSLKRKRDEEDEAPVITPVDELEPTSKRMKELDGGAAESPPPPPPPPPEDEGEATEAMLTEEERDLRAQEEALIRENEEAQRLEDEARDAVSRTESMNKPVPVQ